MTESMKNPVFVLFVIIALGYLLGRVRIGGFSLGVAGALFAGIGLSALIPELSLPPFIYTFGLVLFVYTIGLALGPTFFAGLRKTGLRDNVFTVFIIALAGLGTVVIARLLHIDSALATGLFTGSFTATPALSGVLETLGEHNVTPIIGYSLAYPISILVSMGILSLFCKLWQDKAANTEKEKGLLARTVRYARSSECAVAEVSKRVGVPVVISRVRKNGTLQTPQHSTYVRKGDLLTVVAAPTDIEAVTLWLGQAEAAEQLELENTKFSLRRVFLTNPSLAGRKLDSQYFAKRYKVVITRVRRGDVDMLATDGLVLELGDRLRVVGAKSDVAKASKHIGDSYKQASEMNIFPFAVGITLGVLLGMVQVPLPGGAHFSLGAPGGTIVVAMTLGALRRTGPIVWQIPYSTNIAIRQLGLMIFLAGIGSKAGSEWVTALANPVSYQLMLASAVLVAVVCTVMMVIGHKVLHIPFARLSGMLAAMNTQPTTLARANELSTTNAVNAGYASVYPIALIAKIILAQILLLLLS